VACRAPPTACEGATGGVHGPLLLFSIVLSRIKMESLVVEKRFSAKDEAV
jgi:hypothetical protein